MKRMFCALLACLAGGVVTAPAYGHGYVGDRFFPPTVTTDDPLAADELALPTISYFTNPGDGGSPGSNEIDAGFEFDKEIFPRFAIGVSDTYIAQTGREGGPSAYGWSNVEVTAKYEVWRSEPHEAIVSVGVASEIGGTGSKSVADSFSTFTPKLYLGKGFGDLPDSAAFIRPFAATATLGQTFPTSSASPNTFEWGIAVEYNLLYLQQHVKDVGLPAPFKNMIPLVEFSMQTDENRDSKGITTGTINPGVLWESRYAQLGAEALIPVNSHTGSHVGVVVQMWIYIDDLFPKVFGHPIFGERK
jgi:hypothetical protein